MGVNIGNSTPSTPTPITTPGYVTDGLVGYWDYYPGSGNIWYDLSGKGNHFRLYGSPTFNTGTDQSFSFNGSGQYAQATWDYANFPHGPRAFTLSAFFVVNSGVSGVNMFGIGSNDQNGGRACLATYSSGISMETRNSGYFGQSIVQGNWYQVVVTVPNQASTTANPASLYVNGTFITTGLNNAAFMDIEPVDCCLGTIPGYPFTAWWNGKIGSPMLYNRAITAAEVTQNWNFLKGRYGL